MHAVLCLQEICAPVWFVMSGTASAATLCLLVLRAVPYLSPVLLLTATRSAWGQGGFLAKPLAGRMGGELLKGRQSFQTAAGHAILILFSIRFTPQWVWGDTLSPWRF
jgi:hypothetical protein